VSAPGADPREQLAALGLQLETLSTGLAAQANRLRDAERSLVDRIADVDDDRRRTQGQHLRAMQSQYEEIDARLRRQGALNLLGFGLIAALAAGGLFLLHHNQQERTGELRGDLTAEVQTLGLELGRLRAVATQESQVQDKLAALSTALARVSEDLARVGATGQAEPAAPGPAAEDLGAQIARLESDQERLRTDIEALRTARQAESPQAGADVAPPTEQIAQQVAGLQSDQQRLAGEVDSLRAAVAAVRATPPLPDAGAEPAEAPSSEVAEPQPTSQSVPEPRSDAAAEAEGSAAVASAAPTTDAPPSQAAGQAAAGGQTFALQLMGSYDRAAVLGLTGRPDLPESVFVRQETLRGRPWYVLIHSLHPSYAEAQAELRRLPADLARLDTWIRNLPPDASMEPIRTGRHP
jgi:DamX protein